ncbi:GNAT family N-acetyltransferase [Streptomyces sp. NPDC059918]|uniref:GNAT family N-acetyltransferase n=1 Tax=unclassified Streptomyces TaxID=2593676 RepID=UPI003654DE64
MEREVRTGQDGAPVVTYVRGVREGRPWADRLQVVGLDPVPAILADMSGWAVSGPVELGRELVRRGATVLRHAHTMRRDLTDSAAASWAGTTVRPRFHAVACDRDARTVFPAWREAFPADHPDHVPGTDEQALKGRLMPLMSGRRLGPLLPCSRLAVDESDRVVAGALITDRDGLPWVSAMFRHPLHSYPGLGRDLLRVALADAAGHGLTTVELAVTTVNPARSVYESLGFRIIRTSLTVVVP